MTDTNNYRHHRPKEENIIYGIRPVMEAVDADKEIEKIFIARGTRGELMQELKKKLQGKNIIWQEVPVDKLNRLTRGNHQDVICFISSIAYQSIEDIIPYIFERGEVPLILLLDRITDVRNFGAIARTAECAGVHAIVIPDRGAAQINADAVKTSAGALNIIPVCKEHNLIDTLRFLKQSGLQIIAATEKASEYYFKIDYSQPTVIIMGSEEDGITAQLMKEADALVSLPMHGTIASLNVSVACGVLLYEVLRQRDNK
jgi:23S rRNA (guanosine2251-2'-O)-methyltransferase